MHPGSERVDRRLFLNFFLLLVLLLPLFFVVVVVVIVLCQHNDHDCPDSRDRLSHYVPIHMGDAFSMPPQKPASSFISPFHLFEKSSSSQG